MGSEYLHTLRINRSSSRHLPSADDDMITLETNRRTISMNVRMAHEIYEGLHLILFNGGRTYTNTLYDDVERAARELSDAQKARFVQPPTRSRLEDI